MPQITEQKIRTSENLTPTQFVQQLQRSVKDLWISIKDSMWNLVVIDKKLDMLI